MNFDEAVAALTEANVSQEAKDALGTIIAGAKDRQEFTDEEKEAVLAILDLEAQLLGIQADAMELMADEYLAMAGDMSEAAGQLTLDLDTFTEEALTQAPEEE